MKKKFTRMGAVLLASMLMINSTAPVTYAADEKETVENTANEGDSDIQDNVDDEQQDESKAEDEQKTSDKIEGDTPEKTTGENKAEETPVKPENGMTEENTSGEGTTQEGTTGESTTEEGTTGEPTTEEGTTEEPATEEEPTEESTTEEGTTEELTTEDSVLMEYDLDTFSLEENWTPEITDFRIYDKNDKLLGDMNDDDFVLGQKFRIEVDVVMQPIDSIMEKTDNELDDGENPNTENPDIEIPDINKVLFSGFEDRNRKMTWKEENDDGECTFSITPTFAEESFYDDTITITAYGSGHEAELKRKVSVDLKSPEVKAVLMTDAGWKIDQNINQGWYSEKVNGENQLKISLDIVEDSEIKEISIISEDSTVSYTIPKNDIVKTEKGYHAELPEGVIKGEQNQKYKVVVTDKYGHTNRQNHRDSGAGETGESPIQVKIDNTAPSRDVNIVFSGKENRTITKCQTSELDDYAYLLSTVDGKVYDKESLSLDLKMREGGNTENTMSGISHVTYELQMGSGENGSTEKQTPSLSKDGNNTNYIAKQELILNGDEKQNIYRIRHLEITDYAGNAAVVPTENLMDDRVTYILDNKGPAIEYFEEGSVLEEDGKLYFKGAWNGKVEVTDPNLNFEDDPTFDSRVEVTNISSTSDAGKISYDESSSNLAKAVFNLEMSKDGEYQYKTEATDVLGNRSDESGQNSSAYIIDATAPAIKIEYEKNGSSISPAGSDQSYYNGYVKAIITITERNLRESDIQVLVKGTDDDGQPAAFTTDAAWTRNGDVWTNTVSFNRDGAYSLDVTCADMVGWTAEEKGQSFTIDTKAPQVKISFNHDEPVNGIYYNVERKATITVTDYTFDAESADYDITSFPHSPDISGWSHHAGGGCGGSVHTASCTFESTVDFNEDGEYELEFSCSDKAGNKSNKADGGHFIIDTTAPVFTVTFDNHDVRNERYYNAARTATITVEELSFDSSRIHITKGSDPAADALPTVSGWTGTGFIHTAKVTFASDGTYMIHVDGSDFAENSAQDYDSPLFVIDTTLPVVSFGGVEDYSANNGNAAPTVVYTDDNLDKTASSVTITGSNHGEMDWPASISDIANGKQIVYSDAPHTQEMDDMYTVNARMTDMAGNTVEDSLVFSVNRYGSVYVVDEATQRIVDEYYTGTAPQIAVTEINIDELTMKEVTISRDGETKTLKQGRNYQVNKQGDEMNWKSYTYILPADNFDVDGNYTVALYSEDRAQNTSDNRMKGSEIAFAVDTTEPSIVIDGIEANGDYRESSRTVTMDVQDNMYLTEVTVYKNDMVIEHYDEEKLEENGGTMSFVLSEDNQLQNIEIQAKDLVNNQTQVTFANVWISSTQEKIKEERTPLDAILPGMPDEPQTGARVAVIFVIVAIAGGGAITGTVMYRKRKRAADVEE